MGIDKGWAGQPDEARGMLSLLSPYGVRPRRTAGYGEDGRLRYQRNMNRLLPRLLASEEADGALGFGEGESVRVEALQRVLAGLNETDGALVVGVVDAEGADDRELFEDDLIAVEVGDGLRALGAGEDGLAAAAGEVDRLLDGFDAVGGDVDDDVGHATIGGLADKVGYVVLLDFDGVVGAELAGELELAFVGGEAGDDDAAGAGLAGGDYAGEAALAGTEDDDRVADAEAGHLDGPAEAGAERVEERRDLGRDAVVDLVDEGVRVEVEVVGVAAPEAGRQVDAEIAVGVHAAMAEAQRISAADAVRTEAAGDERLDADAVALLDAPAAGGLVPDLGDPADGLVAGDDGEADGQHALVLLVVGAADAAGLDLEQRVVGADLGQGELTELEGARGGLDDGARGGWHGLSRRTGVEVSPATLGLFPDIGLAADACRQAVAPLLLQVAEIGVSVQPYLLVALWLVWRHQS